ncbi:ABC transporter ATP-binding protein [Planctomycetales bacterium ZRK34]|nr:ABC transporter ATP-binding protein [Planctomycetales bacterium ZRK34]
MSADAPHDDAIIRLDGVHKSFGTLKVLQGVDLSFYRSHTTVVIGPSGCGKSVMLKHIVGLLHPDRGEVWYEDHRVDKLPETELVDIRTNFGYLFQLGALFDSMTVQQNVCFPLEEHAKMTEAERCDRCAEVLGLVGMSNTQNKFPAELSGGQRKRIALARAIALHPKVILYDEPTTGLDPIRSDTINELIIKLKDELHVSSIVVTHDMTSAYKIADRIVMLYDGHIIADATPDELRNTEEPIVRAFIEGRSDMHQIDGLEAAVD